MVLYGYAEFNLLLLVFVRAPCRYYHFIFFLSYLFPSIHKTAYCILRKILQFSNS